MAKFKVGDRVKLINADSYGASHGVEVGDIHTVTYLNTGAAQYAFRVDCDQNDGEWNHKESSWELVKGAKKMKKEKRNYIVVNSNCNNIEHDTLLTKDEAMEKVTSDNHYIIDITNGKRYTKKTTFRMVLQKPEKKKRKGAK